MIFHVMEYYVAINSAVEGYSKTWQDVNNILVKKVIPRDVPLKVYSFQIYYNEYILIF